MRRLEIHHPRIGPQTTFIDPITKELFYVTDIELATLKLSHSPTKETKDEKLTEFSANHHQDDLELADLGNEHVLKDLGLE